MPDGGGVISSSARENPLRHAVRGYPNIIKKLTPLMLEQFHPSARKDICNK